MTILETDVQGFSVIPAKAGIQLDHLDSRFRGNDTKLLVARILILFARETSDEDRATYPLLPQSLVVGQAIKISSEMVENRGPQPARSTAKKAFTPTL